MNSVIVTVEIEVEVFYTLNDEQQWEPVNAICDSQVSREVSKWAEKEAIRQFEEAPAKAIQYSP